MCRVLGYLGPSVSLADLMTKPKNSLVNQSFDAEYHDLLQLGGTGFTSWLRGSPEEDRPLLYRSCAPAFYDKNLQAICTNLRTNNLLAHIRATGYSRNASINDENCHPFIYEGFKLALAHNGGLPGWRPMLHDIIGASRPEIVANLMGSTDTEPLYCLLMSQYADPCADMGPEEIIEGLGSFMRVVRDIKKRHGNTKPAKLKFFLADGNDLVVANIGLGFDYTENIEQDWEELRAAPKGTPEYSLAGVAEPVWYLAGRDYGLHNGQYGMREVSPDDAEAVIISSEHLTDSPADWSSVPFQHVVFFKRQADHCSVHVQRLSF